MLLLLFFITPILGALKNIVKYKKFNFLLFIRSPMLTYLIYLICKYNILLSFILERWFMFIYKIFRAYVTDNYNTKKEKYKLKYNITYLEQPCQDQHVSDKNNSCKTNCGY